MKVLVRPFVEQVVGVWLLFFNSVTMKQRVLIESVRIVTTLGAVMVFSHQAKGRGRTRCMFVFKDHLLEILIQEGNISSISNQMEVTYKLSPSSKNHACSHA